MRTASENILSSKSAHVASPADKRSVSFSRTRHPRMRTSTGKGILKDDKSESVSQQGKINCFQLQMREKKVEAENSQKVLKDPNQSSL